jgi:1-acyl-sn-glycerol-3-phosphate acyltransferase
MCIFLAKEELKKNKFGRSWADFLETSYIDRKNPKTALIAFDQISKKSKIQNKYIVIFPEGTRSKDGVINEFKPGTFHIAKKEFIPIVPVTINNSFSFSDLSRKGKLKVTVIFHRLIKPSSFMTKQTKFISKKVEETVRNSWVKPLEKSKMEKKNRLNG